MTMVLVHGGGMSGRCWSRLLPHLEGDVHVVDLPGRGSRPADLTQVSVADFVDAVVEELVANDLDDVVLVGHSLAGITLPGVAAREADRLRRLVFVACAVPAHGTAVVEVLASFSPATAAVAARLGDAVIAEDGRLHPDLAVAMFCNDMDEEQTAFTLSCLVPEAGTVIAEPTELRGLQAPVPRTYVRLLRDASLTLATQDAMIANLGGAEVVDLDAGHMAMVTQPERLAAILDAR